MKHPSGWHMGMVKHFFRRKKPQFLATNKREQGTFLGCAFWFLAIQEDGLGNPDNPISRHLHFSRFVWVLQSCGSEPSTGIYHHESEGANGPSSQSLWGLTPSGKLRETIFQSITFAVSSQNGQPPLAIFSGKLTGCELEHCHRQFVDLPIKNDVFPFKSLFSHGFPMVFFPGFLYVATRGKGHPAIPSGFPWSWSCPIGVFSSIVTPWGKQLQPSTNLHVWCFFLIVLWGKASMIIACLMSQSAVICWFNPKPFVNPCLNAYTTYSHRKFSWIVKRESFNPESRLKSRSPHRSSHAIMRIQK